eukprot:440402-Prorocentrum_minimum.AAC.1
MHCTDAPYRYTTEPLLMRCTHTLYAQVVDFTAKWAVADLAREPNWSLSKSPVSAHIPLHRTAAAFLVGLHMTQLQLDSFPLSNCNWVMRSMKNVDGAR